MIGGCVSFFVISISRLTSFSQVPIRNLSHIAYPHRLYNEYPTLETLCRANVHTTLIVFLLYFVGQRYLGR